MDKAALLNLARKRWPDIDEAVHIYVTDEDQVDVPIVLPPGEGSPDTVRLPRSGIPWKWLYWLSRRGRWRWLYERICQPPTRVIYHRMERVVLERWIQGPYYQSCKMGYSGAANVLIVDRLTHKWDIEG